MSKELPRFKAQAQAEALFKKEYAKMASKMITEIVNKMAKFTKNEA